MKELINLVLFGTAITITAPPNPTPIVPVRHHQRQHKPPPIHPPPTLTEEQREVLYGKDYK